MSGAARTSSHSPFRARIPSSAPALARPPGEAQSAASARKAASDRSAASIRASARVLLSALLVLAAPSTAEGRQSDPVDECAGVLLVMHAQCTEVALAFQAAQGGTGLLGSGGGSVFAGNASTVGRRLGTRPRVAWHLQLSGSRMSLPAVTEETTAPAREERFITPAFLATVGIGLFDGFSPAPTVGGILAVDGILSGSATLLPHGQGFQNNVFGYGLGFRLGLLRESFTLPGVSISGMLRGSSTVRLGDADAAGPADMAFNLSTVSVRATVGKDFLLFGLLGGVGYDRYRSDADIALRSTGAGGTVTHRMSPRGFTTNRTVFFGGATLTYLVVQLSAEAGWSPGYDEVSGRFGGSAGGAYDPSAGTPFLTLAGRLTL